MEINWDQWETPAQPSSNNIDWSQWEGDGPNLPSATSGAASPSQDGWQQLQRQFALAGRNLVQGAGSFFTGFGDALDQAMQVDPETGTSYRNFTTQPLPRANLTGQFSNALTNAGLPAPQDRGERVAGAIERALPATFLGNPLMGIETESPALLTAATSLNAGASSYAKELGADPETQWITGTSASLLPMAIGSTNLLTSPEEFAANKIQSKLQQSGLSQEDAQNYLTNMGPNASLADLSNPLARLGRAVISQPSEGSSQIQGFLQDRMADQPSRILDAVNQGLGIDPGKSFNETLADLTNQAKTSAGPLYDKAYSANPSMSSPTLDRILQRPAVASALSEAVENMQNSGKLVGIPDAELGEQARQQGINSPGGVAPGLKLEVLDNVKQVLDGQIHSAEYDPFAPTRLKNSISSLKDARTDLVNELDNLDTTSSDGQPGAYSQARAAFSGPTQMAEVARKGQDFILKPNTVSPDYPSSLTDEQKPFFRLGAADGIQQKVNAPNDLVGKPFGPDVMTPIFGSPAKRAALQQVFPDQDSFNNFSNTVNNEVKMRQTGQFMTRQSATIDKGQELQDMGVSPQAVGNALVNPKGFALGKLGEYVSNIGKPSAEKANALAPYFTNQNTLGSYQPTSPISQRIMTPYLNMLTGSGIADMQNANQGQSQ